MDYGGGVMGIKRAAPELELRKRQMRNKSMPIIQAAWEEIKMKEFARNLDQQGRLVIPAEIRQRNNLGPGTLMEISQTSDGILLSPAFNSCAICGSRDDLLDGTVCRGCAEKVAGMLNEL